LADEIDRLQSGFQQSHAQRQHVLDERRADVDTSLYHPGKWIVHFHQGRFLEWWSCCQEVMNGRRDAPGCHHHRPRKIDLGAF
jgi:hypothetical protein